MIAGLASGLEGARGALIGRNDSESDDRGCWRCLF